MLSIRVLLILDVVLIIATVLSYQLWADRSIHLPNRSLKYLAKEMRLAFETLERDFSSKPRLGWICSVLILITGYLLYITFTTIL